MSSSRRAQDTSQQTPPAGLKLTLPVLVTASVLFVAALVLAYLGGVMTGRAQWASSLEESRAALAAAAATDGEKEETAAGEAQAAADAESAEDALAEASVLAASELRFSRALRAEPGARLEPVSPPLPAVQAPKPAAEGGPAYPPMPPGMQPAVPAGEKAPPPTPTDMYDFVFQLGAFRDPGIVDDLRQRLEGRGLRTRMERSGKLYLVMVVMRGTDDRAREVEAIAQDMHLGKPLMQPQACSRPPLGGGHFSRSAGPPASVLQYVKIFAIITNLVCLIKQSSRHGALPCILLSVRSGCLPAPMRPGSRS